MAKSSNTQSNKGANKEAKPNLRSQELDQLNEELQSASGKLLETTGTLHSFMQGLSTSGFRDYVNYMGRPWYIFWFNFLVGLSRGLGFVIGATVLVAFFLWIMTRILTQLPFVGNFFEIMSEFFSPENLEKIKSGKYLESVDELLETFKLNVTEVPPSTDLPQ